MWYNAIKQKRESLGWSQWDLAQRLAKANPEGPQAPSLQQKIGRLERDGRVEAMFAVDVIEVLGGQIVWPGQ